MTDTPASPSYTVTIAGKTYSLDGAFGTIRTLEQHFSRNIIRIFTGLDEMAVHEIAHLIAIAAKAPEEADAIGHKILGEMGVLSRDFSLLKLHLMSWLRIALAPAPDREKKAAEMQATLAAAQNPSPSPGPNTSDSPSAPSDGSPANSGAATSGS